MKNLTDPFVYQKAYTISCHCPFIYKNRVSIILKSLTLWSLWSWLPYLFHTHCNLYPDCLHHFLLSISFTLCQSYHTLYLSLSVSLPPSKRHSLLVGSLAYSAPNVKHIELQRCAKDGEDCLAFSLVKQSVSRGVLYCIFQGLSTGCVQGCIILHTSGA